MKKEKKKKREKRAKAPVAAPEDGARAPAAEKEPSGFGDGSLRYALQTVGGRWKLRILWALHEGKPVRYGQVKRAVSGITDMMLSGSLKELVSAGLVERRQFKEIPPKVDYCLTRDGGEVIPLIRRIGEWAEKRIREDQHAEKK